jgi:PAS domain S-box-containing protein
MAEIAERQRAEEALCASEQRLQDILDNSTAVVSVKDLELHYILVNREYERRFHVQRDRIRGKTDYDIHPGHVAETVKANDRQVIEVGSPIQYEVAIPTAEGERHYVVVKFLLRGRTEKPYAICGIATDITELKRAEELQARRARQAALRADIHAAFSLGTEGALPTILQRSAEAIVRHLGAAFARIWTLNDRQNILELQASAGLYTRLGGEHARVAVGEFKIGRPRTGTQTPPDKRRAKRRAYKSPRVGKTRRNGSFCGLSSSGRGAAGRCLGHVRAQSTGSGHPGGARDGGRRRNAGHRAQTGGRATSPTKPAAADALSMQPSPRPRDRGIRTTEVRLQDPRRGRRPSDGMGRIPSVRQRENGPARRPGGV